MPACRTAARLSRATAVRMYAVRAERSLPLEGRSAIITGASGGIGLAIAETFAQNGAKCLLISRNPTSISAAAAIIRRRSVEGQRIAFVSADVSRQDIWHTLFEHHRERDDGSQTWIEENPQPHILVNAAGITHRSLLLRSEAAIEQSVVDTNLVGTIRACREVGKRMVRRKDVKEKTGCIVNIASLLATHGGRGSSMYAASKAGVIGFTRALAAEYGPLGVRVNAIAPGWIETNMTAGISAESKAELSKKIPLGRFGRVEEVADAALFLATNEYANNCLLTLDGGLSAEM